MGSSSVGIAFCLCMRDHWRVAVDFAVASGVDRQLAAVYLPFSAGLVTNGFVRGLCSGLGMLDIWIGFSEAIHYHEINTN